MSSLFRELNRAAIEADLGKNAFKVFNTLLEQTLGYGKETDRLTNRQLCRLSQVRMDRFVPALQMVLSSKIFEQRPAKKFQYRYTIGKSFLEKNGDKDFFTPALPKKRTDFQKTETISEKERHTALDLDPSLSSSSLPLQTLLSLITEMLQQQMQQQAQLISLLMPAQQNRTATASPDSTGISITYPDAQPRAYQATPSAAVVSVVNISTATANQAKQSIQLCESQLGKINLQAAENLSHCRILKTEPKTEESSQKQNHPQKQKVSPVKSTKSVGGGHDCLSAKEQAEPSDSPVLPLPKATAILIPNDDHPECQTLLGTLSISRQKDVFLVYEDMLVQDKINHPMPLFRTLVEKAQNDALFLPKRVKDAKEANEPTHLSMVIESNDSRLARQDAEDKIHDEGLRRMIRQKAEAQGKSVGEVAASMGLHYLLPF